MGTAAATQRWRTAVFFIAVFWVGMLAGVSFLATPVKFLAPSLSLPVALDVGRHTFAAFSKIEWGLAALLLIALIAQGRARLAMAAALVAAIVVAVEALWLLPVLDQRVGLIIAGQTPPPSRLHMLYIVLECAKLIALLVVAARCCGVGVGLTASATATGQRA